MARSLRKFDISRRRADARVQGKTAFPEAPGSVRCMQRAPPSRTEKSLLSARVQGALSSPVAAEQMRRLLDPRGGAARQDVLVTTDASTPSDDEDLSHEASVAYLKDGGKRGAPEKTEVAGRSLQTTQGRSLQTNKPGNPGPPPPLNEVPRPSWSSVSKETPVSARTNGTRPREKKSGNCEQAFPTSLDSAGQLIC